MQNCFTLKLYLDFTKLKESIVKKEKINLTYKKGF